MAHICRSDGFLSCDKTANHVKECYLSASIKDWSHSQISLGENIFLPLSAPYSHLSDGHLCDVFRLPAVEQLFRPTSAENDKF